MRLPNLARWLRTRNAAITSRRAADAARTKGGLFAKDQTPDCRWCGGAGYFLESRHRYRCLDCNPPVADEVAEFETLCCHRWDVDPDVDGGVHTVQHLCVVAIPSHGYHECACGVWRLEIGAGL